MSEFLDLIESYDRARASAGNIFSANDGVRVGRRRESEQYNRELNEAMRFVADVFRGRRSGRALAEAMTTSDFPLLMGDIIDRSILGRFSEGASTWSQYAARGTVRDFRQAKAFTIDGAEAPMDRVGELEPYPRASLSESQVTRQVYKYGRTLAFTWEDFVNDDLSALRDGPARLARAARRTIDNLATRAHVDANGPHASVYTVGNDNILSGNPALSLSALQLALGHFGEMVDSEGEPIEVEGIVLEVGPALEILARNLLNATEIHATAATLGGGSGIELRAANWMTNRIRLVVNPRIPLVATSANGATTWFLHADPAQTGRPTVQVDFLRGHEEPETFMKSPNAQRVGGGDVDPFAGDFENDAIEYKTRLVVGASIIEPKASLASNGSGS